MLGIFLFYCLTFIYLCIHLTKTVLGTILGPWKTVMNKTSGPCPRSGYMLVGLGNK